MNRTMNNQRTPAHPQARAFTLMELLIAVAALAILAVGVAAVFDTTGKTVQAGRQVSNFSARAALIEQQLRQDISRMTREGFLVIRNQYAAENPTPSGAEVYSVRLHADDTTGGRPRRIDELMFFSKGTFRTARELLIPEIIAESDTARIYYGHGVRLKRDVTPTGLYLRPTIDETHEATSIHESDAILGYPNFIDSPNVFASNWILLRHITLLSPHRVTESNPTLPPNPYGIGNNGINSDVQVALQPAASNLFRSLASRFPLNSSFPNTIRGDIRPRFANGMVDMVTTDLAELRAIIATSDTWPSNAADNFFDPVANAGQDGTNAGPDGQWRPYGTGSGDPDIIARSHAWMNDAFPANSMGARTGSSRVTRIRCEPSPTDFVGVASGNLNSLYPGNVAIEQELRRADQLMLSAHNFLPSCTEFIVEWSMGRAIPSDPGDPNYIAGREGEIIWYGLERRDANNNVIVAPYSAAQPNGTPWRIPITVPLTLVNGQQRQRIVPNTVAANLIHGQVDVTDPDNSVTSYFGWIDPTFDPEDPGRLGGAPSGSANGLLDQPTESGTPTIEWPWPKLIRVTLTLADPNNPAIEQTFQFVFDVPAARAQ